MSRFIDLSHTVADGMITYRGLPGPVITDFLRRDAGPYPEGTSFQIGRIEMVANTGTYLDVPFHRFADGHDLAGLALERVAGVAALLFHAPPDRRAIGPDLFGDADLQDKAVLVHTGFARHWGSEAYFHENPFLTREASRDLVARGASVVGIDSLNIDDIADLTRPAHTLLLQAGIPIVEHMCRLDTLPERGFRFFAVPVKVAGMGTFPVRAFAELP